MIMTNLLNLHNDIKHFSILVCLCYVYYTIYILVYSASLHAMVQLLLCINAMVYFFQLEYFVLKIKIIKLEARKMIIIKINGLSSILLAMRL